MDLNSLLQTPASLAIPAVNIILFLVVQARGGAARAETLIRFGALDRRRIWREGESWRLVTACFLHGGWLHLFMNTYFMFGWCQTIEHQLGTVRFVLAYLMTGIGASAVSVMGHRAVSIGASGAGFGMIGVTLMIYYRHLGSWDAFFSDPGVLSILRGAGIWFLLGIFVLRGLDNWAHGGGFVFGLLGGYALTVSEEEGSGLRIPVLIVVLAIWLGVVWASLHPRFARHPRDLGPEDDLLP